MKRELPFDDGYIPFFANGQQPENMTDQLARIRVTSMPSTSSWVNKKEKRKIKKEKIEKKDLKTWTHYRPRYQSIKEAPWNEKALHPMAYIGFGGGDLRPFDDGTLGGQNGTRRPPTPEWPENKYVTVQEKNAAFHNALTNDNEDEDLFPNEERLNPRSVQSADMVEGDAFENYNRYDEIYEHARLKYFDKFREDEHPWLEKPGNERPIRKKPNYLWRVRSTALFYQKRVTKRIVWNAKYNRFYRNYKYGTPRLNVKDHTFPDPRRQEEPPYTINEAEGSWNLRKWTLSTTVQPINLG